MLAKSELLPANHAYSLREPCMPMNNFVRTHTQFGLLKRTLFQTDSDETFDETN